ncbi:tyrosine-type recombinase/integrase [Pseudomonas sp. 008]|uniref:tyrosine-type recombinase/integrase n=1 Tax=Pseudomonas sp. 008 TaxID=2803906 RepID=UPI00195006A8|nr:tyrosine-type recombinase/integrase [Pseudomonas sp. 008]GID06839.1 hypothetical protein TMM008_40410 [Pseudomonas sp. 008]
MIFSQLLHLESPPVAIDGLHYAVFSCLQWKSPNLELMPQASKQRFAILYNQPLENSFVIETLEQAHIQGAMSGVKVVAVHKNSLYIFLSKEVVSITLPAIENLWTPVTGLDLNQRLNVDFACEDEVYSGRSDYTFWPTVKEILKSNELGIAQYATPLLGRSSDMVDDEKELRFDAGNIGLCASAIPKMKLVQGSSVKCLMCSNAGRKTSSLENFPPEREPLHQSALEVIGQAVKRRGNLRDACLHALMLVEGFRANEIRLMKASDLSQNACITVRLAKNLWKTRTQVLSAESYALINHYVEASGVSGDDFLFPSARDHKQPISPALVKKLFQAWLIEANIAPPHIYLHIIERALRLERSKAAMQSIARKLGHPPKLTTEYYLSSHFKKQDA